MSSIILPSSSPFMAAPHEPPSDSFHSFFELWLSEQNQLLHQLTSAAESPNPNESDLRRLVARVLRHYHHYYHHKSRSASHDVLSVLTPPWRSKLEDAFLWIGGWRPSTAFHLLYSKSGLQFSDRFDDLLRGTSTATATATDLSGLSPSQLSRVDDLQRDTLREEKAIAESMAVQQEKIADSSMVELTHAVAEMARGGGGGEGGESVEERVESALAPKEEGLKEMLRRADDLRVRTLRGVIEVLSPIQAVHFLIAAAELHIWVHQWGKKRDDSGPTGQGGEPAHAHYDDEAQIQ